MTYVNVTEFAKEFRVTGDWPLQEAEAEFEKGDFVQASEKSWGAAAQHRSEAAVRAGMDDVRRFVSILAAMPPQAQPPLRNRARARPFVGTRDCNP